MAVKKEITAKEKLIDFIHHLSDEEVKIVISFLQTENISGKEQPV